MRNAQALVEFALVLPVLMFLLLGFGEAAFLVATRQGYQNGVDVMADWAAIAMATNPGESWRAGWNGVVNDEADRHGCHSDPAVILPDGTHAPGDRVVVRWVCHYQPRITTMWEGLAVAVESEAVVPLPPPVIVASPSPSLEP